MVVSTRRRASEAFSLMQLIQDSGCVSSILEFLPPEDLCHFALCSKTLYDFSKEDSTLSFLRNFTYSKSWWSWFDRLEDQEYADDYPFNKLRRGGLEEDFASLYAKNEAHFFQSIVAWCGGWEAFSQTRMNGAPPAIKGPNDEQSPDIRRAGDNNGIHNPCKPVVIFDIHCDGEWKWTAFHPLCNDDLRSCQDVEEDEDELNFGVFYPYSTLSLGDFTDNTTGYAWNHGRRPNRYLLSTDSSDTRTFKLSVSIVSPNFAETHVESAEFVPHDLCQDEEREWENVPTRHLIRDRSFRVDPKVRYHEPEAFGGENESFGRQEDGTPDDRSPILRLCFYRDTRKKPERFHMVLSGLWFPTLSYYNMLVHPPASAANQTRSRRSKKRRA